MGWAFREQAHDYGIDALAEDIGECWCGYFGDLLEKSPTLRYWYAETRDWYEPHVCELLDHLAAGRFLAGTLSEESEIRPEFFIQEVLAYARAEAVKIPEQV